MTFARGTFWFAIALSLTLLIAGCSTRYVVPTAASPTAASSSTASAFSATVHIPDEGPGGTAVALYGLASEMTDAGEVAVEGVEVFVMSCNDASSGCGTNIQKSTKTNENGVYRIERLYPGRNNFVWIAKDGYEPVGLPAFLEVCDDCNKILTLPAAEETEFDFSLARK